MVKINGKKIEFFSSIDTIINNNKNGIYISIAAESLASKDINFINIINSESSICYADGEMAVLGLKRHGYKNAVKIPGVELWEKFLDKTSLYDTYIIGSTDDVINNILSKMKCKYGKTPKLIRNGFLNDNDILEVKRKLVIDKPHMVILALGQPKQEILADILFKEHSKCKYLCVGGALDVYSGKVKRAPKFFIKYKLEWFYRLIKTPSRFKRQIVILPCFLKVLFFR